jgi:hypothetical protein
MCAIASQSRSSASLAGRPGYTISAQSAVGAGAAHQFVVRRLTTLPISGRYGSKSRPERSAGMPSSAWGAWGPLSEILAARSSERERSRSINHGGM